MAQEDGFRGGFLSKFTIYVTLIVAAVTFGMNAAWAERRVALVIGNSSYQHTAPLKNPRNDAIGVAEKLRALDFDVVEGIDLDQDGMQQTIGEFAEKVSRADVGLFYYAGHGLQVRGENFLIPIDSKLRTELDLQFKAVKLNLVLAIMEGSGRTSIVLLDACRDNPLAQQLARSMGTTRSASVGTGLAQVKSGVGTYIGFSTEPGNVALDGDGNNSPFTTALLNRIDTENENIESIMRLVRADVVKATKKQQIPWGNSSLIGDGFVFKRSVKVEQQASIVPAVTLPNKPTTSNGGSNVSSSDRAEFTFWDAIKDSQDANFFQAYLDQFPTGYFNQIAKLKLASLKLSGDGSSANSRKATRSSDTSDIAYWESVKDNDNAVYLESYVSRYPNGIFVEIAKLKIAELKSTPKPDVKPKPAVTTQVPHSANVIGEIPYWNSIVGLNVVSF